jgi:hypothetical protein
MCVAWISEQTVIISPYSFNLTVFITRGRECLLRGTNWVFKPDKYSFVLKGLKCRTHSYSAVCSWVSINPSQGIYEGIWSHSDRRHYKLMQSHTSCLLVVLQSYCNCLYNSNDPTTITENLKIHYDACCPHTNCSTLCLFPYAALSEAKNYSAINSGMSLLVVCDTTRLTTTMYFNWLF